MLSVTVQEDPVFKREGDDLRCEVPITFIEAALGAEITVPTKNGPVKMKVPPGTQSDQTLRLAGMGIPHLKGGGAGDQLVTVKVVVPKKLSRRQRELVEQLAQEDGENPRVQLEAYRIGEG